MKSSRGELIVSCVSLALFAVALGVWVWVECERSRRAREVNGAARAIAENIAARGFDA